MNTLLTLWRGMASFIFLPDVFIDRDAPFRQCILVDQIQRDVEKEQEAQLRAKYPGMKGPGTSALLQKRLSQKV